MSSILLDSVIVNIILLNSVNRHCAQNGGHCIDEMYERIEQLCFEAGVNVTTMCRKRRARSALSDYKAGRIKSLAADKLAKIAGYFNVSVDHLLGKEEKPAAPKDGELVKDD